MRTKLRLLGLFMGLLLGASALTPAPVSGALPAGFKGHIGKFFSADFGSGTTVNWGQVWANKTFPGSWEQFQIIPLGACTFAFRSTYNGKYVSADRNKGGLIIADRNSIGPWERFQFQNAGGGYYGLKNSNGMWVSVQPNGMVIANRSAVGPWEKIALFGIARIPCPPAPFCPTPMPAPPC